MTESKTSAPDATDETPRCQREGETHRPDDSPDGGNRCKYCGRPTTWTGPGMYDWEISEDAELPEPVDRFLTAWAVSEVSSDVASRLTCGEVEALCGLFEHFDRPDLAEKWREDHADGDTSPEDRHYRGNDGGN
ncbi:hypothetical protein [Saccharopolyspora taberi]|uniref:Uncharacterized protein n=1 Tax=Saccharopolyspora taberi TaxID=60895 RepID=A0ABN3VKA4_9PSEU